MLSSSVISCILYLLNADPLYHAQQQLFCATYLTGPQFTLRACCDFSPLHILTRISISLNLPSKRGICPDFLSSFWIFHCMFLSLDLQVLLNIHPFLRSCCLEGRWEKDSECPSTLELQLWGNGFRGAPVQC